MDWETFHLDETLWSKEQSKLFGSPKQLKIKLGTSGTKKVKPKRRGRREQLMLICRCLEEQRGHRHTHATSTPQKHTL